MFEVLVPRENVNDDFVVIRSIHVLSGESVKKGQVVVEVETSKTNIEIEAPDDGKVSHDLSEGDQLSVGSILFIVGEASTTHDNKEKVNAENTHDDPNFKGIKFSIEAEKRIKELGISKSIFNKGWITAYDVNLSQNIESNSANRHVILQNTIINRSGKDKIIILGGGGHSKMCLDILKIINRYEIIGVIDSKLPIGSSVFGVEVIGKGDEDLKKIFSLGVSNAINAVGSILKPAIRKTLFEKLKVIGFSVPNLIHPSAIVEQSSRMGEGNQIMMGASIGSDVSIGDNCIVNSGAIVSHDSVLMNHSHIAPGAILAGGVSVGELAVVGMGSTIYMGLKISERAIIGNGSNVFRDILSSEFIMPQQNKTKSE